MSEKSKAELLKEKLFIDRKNGLRSASDEKWEKITAFCEGTAVAMGRLVGDGAMYWYIQDMAVLPEYQGKGIGKSIVERLLQHVYSCTPNGTFTTVGLMAAQGKEGFYEKLGFQAMPNAGSGAGMTRYIEKNWRNSSSNL